MPDLSKQQTFLNEIMKKLEFPTDAQENILNAFDKIAADNEASACFLSLLESYANKKELNASLHLEPIKVLAKALNIHEYTTSMILLLCMGKQLLVRYKEKGLSEELWLHTLRDLKYKLSECRLIHKIDGTCVAWWYPGFYNLERFALGRLQFEITHSGMDYSIGNRVIPKGSKQINIHIPTTGTRLDHNEVLNSYKLAAEMFKDEFEGKPIVFHCQSWLLSPWHKEILPEKSNIVEFFDDFKIVAYNNYNDYSHLLLLFGCEVNENADSLPNDSTLRRLYIERIKNKQPVSWGQGAFIYDNGKIIND